MTNSDVRNYYDAYWTEGGWGFAFSDHPAKPTHAESPYAPLLSLVISPNANVLELGCGDGAASGVWLKSTGRKYLGLDISRPAIEAARSRGLDAETIDDAARLPVEDAAYDAVVCTEVFEHLFLPNEAAAEIYRALKPGGVLVATTPNAVYWRRRFELVKGTFNPYGDFSLSLDQPWRDPHIRFFTPSTLPQMLREAGFNNVQVGGHGGAIERLSRLRGGEWHLGIPRWPIRQIHDRLAPYLGEYMHAIAYKPS